MRGRLCIYLFLAVSVAFAQETIPGRTVPTPPEINGIVTDAKWSSASVVHGVVSDTDGKPCPYGTTFWVGYDSKYIYFAARCEDPDPGQIHAVEYATNVSVESDDFAEVDLDVSGSNIDYSAFKMNPRGASFISLAGGRAAKREWLGEVKVAARITPTGWEGEMRIPWAIMRLPSKGPHDLRMNFVRRIARLNRYFVHVFAGGEHSNDAPIWKSVDLPNPPVDRSIKLLPFTYLGYDPRLHGIANMGMDMKTELGRELQLVGSINPDFRNIENQVLSLDFSRFERLAGETRPFFQEGSQYIGSALFASQRIGQFTAGANTYGKLNNRTSFGFIEADDMGRRNNVAGTLTQQLDKYSDARIAVTNMTGALDDKMSPIAGSAGDRDTNNSYLVRYERQRGPYSIFLRDMGSQDSLAGFGRQTDAEIDYAHRGLYSGVGFTSATPRFNPLLGFFPERDFRGGSAYVSLNRKFDRGYLNDFHVNANESVYYRTSNEFYRRAGSAWFDATDRKGRYLTLGVDQSDFEGSHDHSNTVTLGMPRANPYRNVEATYNWGEFSGIRYDSAALTTAYRPIQRLQLTGRCQVVRYDGYDQQVILGGNYDLGSDRSVAGRLVRQGSNTNGYLAYRRSGNRGMEYFLILGDPNAVTFRSSLILKVALPFTLR